MGAFFPGIKAVQIIISCLEIVSAIKRACFSLYSLLISFAYPPEVSDCFDSSSSTIINLAPKLSTCSFVALLTSVAQTTAPNLFAVAIACKPATPTPKIITFAGLTLPAAVIIIGKAFLNFSAASITALYPAKLA